MTEPTELRERAWRGMLKARMNAIYYERVVASNELADKVIRLSAAVLASAGVVAAIKWLNDDRLAMLAGLLSAVLSGLSVFAGFADRGRAAATLLPRYVEHFNLLRKLYDDGLNVDAVALATALSQLDETAVVEAEKIKTSNRRMLRKAQALVLEEYNLPKPPNWFARLLQRAPALPS